MRQYRHTDFKLLALGSEFNPTNCAFNFGTRLHQGGEKPVTFKVPRDCGNYWISLKGHLGLTLALCTLGLSHASFCSGSKPGPVRGLIAFTGNQIYI